jgi:hypothetical protein
MTRSNAKKSWSLVKSSLRPTPRLSTWKTIPPENVVSVVTFTALYQDIPALSIWWLSPFNSHPTFQFPRTAPAWWTESDRPHSSGPRYGAGGARATIGRPGGLRQLQHRLQADFDLAHDRVGQDTDCPQDERLVPREHVLAGSVAQPVQP